MAAIKTAKTVGTVFTNKEEVVHATYNFADDAGAVGSLDVFTAGADIIITHFSSTVKTAATSGGSATLAVGVTGSLSLFMTIVQGAVASLTLGAVIVPIPVLTEGTPNTIVMPCPVKLPSGSKVIQAIATAALTAGKVEYCMKYVRA